MNPDGQKSKGSLALSISQGLVDPKAPRNSKGSKGQLVNIPVPPISETDALGIIEPGLRPVESRKLVDAVMARSERISRQRKSMSPRAREKGDWCSYRDPTQVLCQSKARPVGRTDVREFGKLVPYVRNKGCLPRERQVAVTRALRLSSNNTGDCKSARYSH